MDDYLFFFGTGAEVSHTHKFCIQAHDVLQLAGRRSDNRLVFQHFDQELVLMIIARVYEQHCLFIQLGFIVK